MPCGLNSVGWLNGAIFDLDGTLVDTLPVCFAAFRATLERFGEPQLTDDQIGALFGPNEDGIMQRVVPDRWQDAVATYITEYERHLAMCPTLFSGMAAALRILHERQVPLGLVTGKGHATTVLSLRHFGLEGMCRRSWRSCTVRELLEAAR